MSKMWAAVPEGVRTYALTLARMWLSVVGLVMITWGACLFLLPAGVILGGFCALLLDWGVGVNMARGGAR